MDAKRIDIPRGVDPVVLFGTSDRVLRALENGFPQVRGEESVRPEKRGSSFFDKLRETFGA